MPKRAAMASRVCAGSWSCRTADQQGVEHRLIEAHARIALGTAQERHVERGIVRDQHGIAREAVKLRQDHLDRQPAGDHGIGDAVKTDRRPVDRPPGIDQRIEQLAAQQSPVDDP
jgi:hypothetical protein